jgi:zinc transport system substrate-binding protein
MLGLGMRFARLAASSFVTLALLGAACGGSSGDADSPDTAAVEDTQAAETTAGESTAADDTVPETTAATPSAAETTIAATVEEPLLVVADTLVMAELVSRVGGDGVKVVTLSKPGIESHDVELSPDQVREVQEAALVVSVSEGFQPALDASLKDRAGAVVRASNEAAAPDIHEGEEEGAHSEEEETEKSEEGKSEEGHTEEGHSDEGEIDPHVWLDPTVMVSTAQKVNESLSSLRPGAAESFRANTEAYVAELTTLDADITKGLTTCKRRVIVTAHKSFGYFVERYKLTEYAVAGLSPEAEPTAAQLRALTKLVKDEQLTTVFTDELASAKVAEALAREAGVATAVLSPLETISSSDLEAGATYLSKMRDNLTTLQQALDCTVV